ncbi:hypothetical protein OE88DRAFT_1739015 [Heliocybe sulcata]|uniref:Fungal-type protein kinase domain-containing protein n=1 Tax=Heliocybe sulcata TaxID=5364 RepID=A0A5C3MPU5_9AGAM|nr:hypothetical protein OE88DRAFT_1739015 [Heliocybe sulcata]
MSDDENSGASTSPSPRLGSRVLSTAPSLSHPVEGPPPATPSPKGSPSPSLTPAPRESESGEELQDPGVASRKRDKGKQRADVPRDPSVVAAPASAAPSLGTPPPALVTGGKDTQVHNYSHETSLHSSRTSGTTFSHVMPASATIEREGKATQGLPTARSDHPLRTRRRSDADLTKVDSRRGDFGASTLNVAQAAATMAPVPPDTFFGTESSRRLVSAPSKLIATPHKSGSETHKDMDQPDIDKLQYMLSLELEDSWVNGGEAFVPNLVRARPTIASTVQADAFLFHYEGFDSITSTWLQLPAAPNREPELYGPFVVHLRAILNHFGIRTRQIAPTHGTRMQHHDVNRGGKRNISSPDISVVGFGPLMGAHASIKEPVRYSQCVAVIEVKTDASMEAKWAQHRLQLAVYARECFVQQPSRRFFYGVLLSQKTIQLFQFDRGGAVYSKAYDINRNAAIFVQIVLVISTEDEVALGFDNHIFWDSEGKCWYDSAAKNDFKAGSEVKRNKEYEVVSKRPFYRAAIRGRGTTCWRVQDSEKNQLLLKLSWRTTTRKPEAEFLRAAMKVNLEHVGTMIETKNLGLLSRIRWDIPLVAERVGGRDVHATLRQLILSTGSKELLSIGILHRDISVNNIVLDRRRDTTTKAKLIDMDMAIFIDRDKTGVKTDVRTGTRAFQSLKVLAGIDEHNHLDELEYCFWVFCFIIFTYDKPRVKNREFPPVLSNFHSLEPTEAIEAKRTVLDSPRMTRWISSNMGPGIFALFLKLQAFFNSVTAGTLNEIDARRLTGPDAMTQRVLSDVGLFKLPEVSQKCHCRTSMKVSGDCNQWLHVKALQHYTLVLEMVREAIDLSKKHMLATSAPAEQSRTEKDRKHGPSGWESETDGLSDEGFSDGPDVAEGASWEGGAGYAAPAAGVTSRISGLSNKRSAAQSFEDDKEEKVPSSSKDPGTSRATKRLKGSHSRRK